MLQRLSLRQWGAHFALFAVALQFLLSFAHVHPLELAARNHFAVQISAPTSSAPNRSDGLAGASEDACAICASIALLAITALPDGVRLPLLPFSAAIVLRENSGVLFRPPAFRLFQTRAPPAI